MPSIQDQLKHVNVEWNMKLGITHQCDSFFLVIISEKDERLENPKKLRFWILLLKLLDRSHGFTRASAFQGVTDGSIDILCRFIIHLVAQFFQSMNDRHDRENEIDVKMQFDEENRRADIQTSRERIECVYVWMKVVADWDT
jgi:hypothetical protein